MEICYNVIWMDITLFTIIKVLECKLGPFEYTQSMSKWPARSVYVGNIFNYLIYLPDPFPRGLQVDLEGSSTFLTITPLVYMDRLCLFSHLYRSLFHSSTIWQGSWAGATAFCIDVGWHCTIAISAWCSTHQLPGCECAVKVSQEPLGCLNAACMGIYNHMEPYIHAFKCMYNLKIYTYILLHLLACLFTLLCIYTCICAYIGVFWLTFGLILYHCSPGGESHPLLQESYIKLPNANTTLVRHYSTQYQHCILKHRTTKELGEIAKQQQKDQMIIQIK